MTRKPRQGPGAYLLNLERIPAMWKPDDLDEIPDPDLDPEGYQQWLDRLRPDDRDDPGDGAA